MNRLTNAQIEAAELSDWRRLAQGLHARYVVPEATRRAAFVAAVTEVMVRHDHHPDVRITARTVDFSLFTRDDGRWITPKDVELAREISELAHDQGLVAAPNEVAQLELALDTADEDLVAPFWAALLTGRADNRVYDSVFDPTDRVPSLWFQGRTAEDEQPSQRWHFDLWLAPEEVADRIAAAVASGGRVVDDEQAPAFTVLADPEGNRVCICTQRGRE